MIGEIEEVEKEYEEDEEMMIGGCEEVGKENEEEEEEKRREEYEMRRTSMEEGVRVQVEQMEEDEGAPMAMWERRLQRRLRDERRRLGGKKEEEEEERGGGEGGREGDLTGSRNSQDFVPSGSSGPRRIQLMHSFLLWFGFGCWAVLGGLLLGGLVCGD